MTIVGGIEQRVNSTTTRSQYNGVVTALDDGGWVVAWQSEEQDGSNNGVYQQRYDALGMAVGGEVLVNTNTYLDQAEPAITGLADGGWIVTWQSYWQNSPDWTTYFQRFGADGDRVGSENYLDSGYSPEVAGLPTGGWILTWDVGGDLVRADIYTAAGTTAGPTAPLGGAYAREPSVAVLADGGWIIVATDLNDGYAEGIYQQRFDANGAPIGTGQWVNTTSLDMQYMPVVEALSDGGWLVVWRSDDGIGGGTIQMQRYDSAGVRQGSETMVNTTVGWTDRSEPTVHALTDGGWVIAWQGEGTDDVAGVFQRVYGADGNPVGDEMLVNIVTAGAQVRPAVTALADGSWIVTWDGEGSGDADGVYQRQFYINDAPIVDNAIADQTGVEDAAFSFIVPVNTFSDANGNTLTYAAQLLGGGMLPTWLSFDAATRTFSGTPANGDVGTVSVAVTANDGNGGTVTDTFDISVSNTNDAPHVANTIPNQTATEGAVFNFQFALNAFNDVDVGDALTYSARLAGGGPLAPWLSFDPSTRTFSGTPARGDVGSLAVEVRATDGSGASVTDSFDLVVAAVNSAPTVQKAISAQQAMEDQVFIFQVDPGVFADADAGDTLSYSARLANGLPLPAWLVFDAASRTFSGMPDGNTTGPIAIDIIATDGAGANASARLDLTVLAVNDAPVAIGGAIRIDENAVHIFQSSDFGFNDADGNDLSAVVIGEVPATGKFRFDGHKVASGMEINVADISRLTWKPKANGDSDSSISFFVVDDGGTENGGSDRSTQAATISLDVADRIVGSAGKQMLKGTAGDDILVGGRGNDRLIGGKGADTFVFRTRDDRDVILDFQATGPDHDVLDLNGVRSVSGFTDLMESHAETVGRGVRIDAGNGDVIILAGVKLEDLDAEDFLF